jgi:hypothetical protein
MDAHIVQGGKEADPLYVEMRRVNSTKSRGLGRLNVEFFFNILDYRLKVN